MAKGSLSVMTNFMTTVGLGVVFVYMAVVVLMYAFQRNLLYYPGAPKPTRAQSDVADMVELAFTTADDLDLYAWYAAAKDSTKPTVVIFHGNAGTLGGRGFKARVFLDAGYGVMLAEYRGYGGNSGKPSQEGLFADARAALTALKQQGVQEADTALYGESLGTGVATQMAAEAQERGAPIAALILEAPFTSAVDVGAAKYPFLPVRMLLKDPFDSLGRIKDVLVPVFIVHGQLDQTVPIILGKRLFEAANFPKEGMWIARAGHNDLYDFGAGEGILEFLAKVDASRAAKSL